MEGITLKALGPEDADLLLAAPEGLFDHPARSDLTQAFLADPAHLIVLALAAGQPVGFASGVVQRHPDKEAALFVNEVGVIESHRRRGIGRAVTERLIEEAGCAEAWLATEPDNEPALALYRSMGGEALPVVAFGWGGALDASRAWAGRDDDVRPDAG